MRSGGKFYYYASSPKSLGEFYNCYVPATFVTTLYIFDVKNRIAIEWDFCFLRKQSCQNRPTPIYLRLLWRTVVAKRPGHSSRGLECPIQTATPPLSRNNINKINHKRHIALLTASQQTIIAIVRNCFC